MYILSKELTERIAGISQKADTQSSHVLLYEEFSTVFRRSSASDVST